MDEIFFFIISIAIAALFISMFKFGYQNKKYARSGMQETVGEHAIVCSVAGLVFILLMWSCIIVKKINPMLYAKINNSMEFVWKTICDVFTN